MDLTYSYKRFGNPQHHPDDDDSTGEDSSDAAAVSSQAQRPGHQEDERRSSPLYHPQPNRTSPQTHSPHPRPPHPSLSPQNTARSVFGGVGSSSATRGASPAFGAEMLRDPETGGPFLTGLFASNQNQNALNPPSYFGPDFSALRNSDEFSHEDNVSVTSSSSSNHSQLVKAFPGTAGSVHSFGTLFRRYHDGQSLTAVAPSVRGGGGRVGEVSEFGTGSTSFFGAVFIVCNAALGAAVLNLPYAFLTVGDIRVALAVQAVTVLLVFSTLFWLGYLAEVCQVASYEGVIGRVWGRKVKFAVELVVVVYALFSCIAYQVIVGDQMEYVLSLLTKASSDMTGDGGAETGRFREISIVLSAFVVLPLCIPRDISYLTYPGFVSVVGVLYIAVVIVVRYLQPSSAAPDPAHFSQVHFSWQGLTGCLPTFLFAYQCHVSSVPVYASLKHRSLTRWVGVIVACLLLVSCIYAVVGVFGFLSFGSSTYPDVLMGYDRDDSLVTAGRLMLLCSVLLSYPIMHYVARSAYENLLRRGGPASSSVDSAAALPQNAIFTPAWLLISLSAALFIPGLNVVIEKVGATAAFFILGFPGMCLVELSRYSRHWLVLVLLAILYTALCAFIFSCSFLSFLN